MSVNTNKSEKDKALEAAMAQIQKQFGKGAIMKLGDDSAQMNIDSISTGSISLDIATGIGGVPKGRIVEIYGPESSGKTTLTLHIEHRRRKQEAKQPSLMRNMHWIRYMPGISVLMWENFWYLSQIQENRL